MTPNDLIHDSSVRVLLALATEPNKQILAKSTAKPFEGKIYSVTVADVLA